MQLEIQFPDERSADHQAKAVEALPAPGVEHHIGPRMHQIHLSRRDALRDAVLGIAQRSGEQILKGQIGIVFEPEPSAPCPLDLGIVAGPQERAVWKGTFVPAGERDFPIFREPVLPVVVRAVFPPRDLLNSHLPTPFLFQIILFRKRMFSRFFLLFL